MSDQTLDDESEYYNGVVDQKAVRAPQYGQRERKEGFIWHNGHREKEFIRNMPTHALFNIIVSLWNSTMPMVLGDGRTFDNFVRSEAYYASAIRHILVELVSRNESTLDQLGVLASMAKHLEKHSEYDLKRLISHSTKPRNKTGA